MAAWTSIRDSSVEAPPTEGAAMELVTGFGSGTSVLRPFDELAGARQRRQRAAGARLGELLLAHELVTEDELAEALAEQRKTKPKKLLGEIVLRQGLVSAPTLVRLLATQAQLELEEEKGFGTGLRRAIELRHQEDRMEPEAEPEPEQAPDATAAGVPHDHVEPAAETAAPPIAPRRLGELLVEKGLLTGSELDAALTEQEDSGRMLGEVVVDLGYVPMITLVNVLTEQLNGECEQQSGFGTGLRQLLETQLLQQRDEAAA
jgi:pyruvate/2-oxoglutarate dehydrogenase complex dihydrolipoamide acyltransferase (E2) component